MKHMGSDQDQGNKTIDERLEEATASQAQASDEVAEEKQPEPMPSSEETQAEEAPQEGEQQTVEGNDLELPEGASDRTKAQFEKLKKQLQDERAKNQEQEVVSQKEQYGSSVFDSFRPQDTTLQQPAVDPGLYSNLSQKQVSNITDQFVDREGNVDIDGLNKALQQSNQRAEQALDEARRTREDAARIEETRQTREAHTKYPQLDPLSKSKDGAFDPVFFELVRDRLLRNMYEGKSQTLVEVADDISTSYRVSQPQNTEHIQKEAVEKYKKAQKARQQGPIQSGKGEDRASAQEDIDELRRQTRRGGFAGERALEERLKRLGI